MSSKTTDQNCRIRRAQPGDEPQLLLLMQALAEFEGYLSAFRVTEQALTEVMFQTGQVQALVAEDQQQLVAMLVFYQLPFSYDLKPWWYIKELYVKPAYRSQQLGQQLMQQLISDCRAQGGSKVRWDVLSTNQRAKAFYQSQGGAHDQQWELFSLKLR
ncbi:GNAT family N-acetyltransferase [Oceanospirillum sediminis]|uniref:GNAT family N-acetyltransferase n=1 Tax=Oceanospirillum sediminis TaxID=2760088 RepID=A0A839IJJ3_9GAMM|nr:GNAT family N-acetyltransferase [Oceanospirillum sediminis]MBB1485098.1 GNAT family N-acetyltransferase [Oceanospirillum sediminis]